MKRFDEAFPGLNPPKDMKAYFDISRIVRVSAGKDMQVLRIHMESERLIEKEIIYKMEDCIKNSLFSGKKMKVKILEKFRLSNLYNPENLYAAYKNSILTELRRYRITQYLMLSRGEVRFEGNSLFLSVEDNLLNREEAGDLIHILEKIFFERCGMDCRVEVTFIPYRPPSLPDSDYENKRENREDSHRDVFMAAASGLLPEEGDFKSPEAENPAMFPESPKEKRRASAGEKRTPAQRGGRFEAGKKKNPDLLFGRDFPDSFLALQDIMGEMGEVSIWGKIIDLDFRYLEKSQSTMFVFSISDFTDSITVKLFVRENDLADVRSYLKKGEFVKVRGMTTLDKFDGELIIGSVRGLKKAGSFAEAAREDAAPLKRVELHCHTKMSDFDGVSGAKDLIEQASRWGMEAIAITDHGNVQSFTDAVHAYDDLQKKKAHLPKIIYGLEAYLIDDKKGFLTNPGETTLDDAFVVFDIETTGLSAVKDRIIEIGAVKMRQGVILERS